MRYRFEIIKRFAEMLDAPARMFTAIGAEAKVDLEARIIRGFAVATIGPALGHGEEIDATTLDQIAALGNAQEISCHINHPGPFEGASPLQELVGFAVNFRRDGNVGRADFKALSIKAAPHSDTVLHLALEAPRKFGASIVFGGTVENGKTRVENLIAIDFVDRPAANPGGMFGKGKEQRMADVIKPEKGEDGKWYCTMNGQKYEVQMPEEKKPDTPVKQNGATAADPNAVAKDINGMGAGEAAKALSEKHPSIAEALKAEGREQEKKYSADFETVMTSAGLEGKTRTDFRAKYYGRPLETVKEFASLLAGQRATPKGEGGAQEGSGAEDAELAKAFAEMPSSTRRMFGVHTQDIESDEYKKGLKAYIAAQKKIEIKKK